MQYVRVCERVHACLVCMAAAGAPGARRYSQRGSAFDPCCWEIFILSVWCTGMAMSSETSLLNLTLLITWWWCLLFDLGIKRRSTFGLYVIGISSLVLLNEFLMTYWSAGEIEAVLGVYRFTMHSCRQSSWKSLWMNSSAEIVGQYGDESGIYFTL